jgi:hypothetical protein
MLHAEQGRINGVTVKQRRIKRQSTAGMEEEEKKDQKRQTRKHDVPYRKKLGGSYY